MNLVDVVRTWLESEPDLKHFRVEHSNAEDFEADWITCSCSEFILASIKDSSVVTVTKPLSDDPRLRLPEFYNIPAHHPQFFEMIKFSLLNYHQTYL